MKKKQLSVVSRLSSKTSYEIMKKKHLRKQKYRDAVNPICAVCYCNNPGVVEMVDTIEETDCHTCRSMYKKARAEDLQRIGRIVAGALTEDEILENLHQAFEHAATMQNRCRDIISICILTAGVFDKEQLIQEFRNTFIAHVMES